MLPSLTLPAGGNTPATHKLLPGPDRERRHLIHWAAGLVVSFLHLQSSEEGASWLYQNYILTKRNLINNWRNVGIFWLRLGMWVPAS